MRALRGLEPAGRVQILARAEVDWPGGRAARIHPSWSWSPLPQAQTRIQVVGVATIVVGFSVGDGNDARAIADGTDDPRLVVRGLADADRADPSAEVEHSFGRFTAANGYKLPGVALCAVAR
jgi:hypothetical protein